MWINGILDLYRKIDGFIWISAPWWHSSGLEISGPFRNVRVGFVLKPSEMSVAVFLDSRGDLHLWGCLSNEVNLVLFGLSERDYVLTLTWTCWTDVSMGSMFLTRVWWIISIWLFRSWLWMNYNYSKHGCDYKVVWIT